MDKHITSPSPHIFTRDTTTSIMLNVILALLPAAIASVVFFGARSIAVIAVCIIAAAASEALFNLCCKKKQSIGDLSAIVTGLLLALNLPSTIPLWQAAVGAVFSIVVVKCLFGGIGQNFANPAITGRIFMLIAFSSTMTASVFPQSADLTAGATPLAVMAGQEGTLPSLWELFAGNCGGALGETSALALLIGGAYLIIRGIISWRTPVVFIATVFVITLISSGDISFAAAQILSGGLFIGAFFMATDYTTTPNSKWGRVVFGLGCGLITSLIRLYGSYPEGVSFSILLMNILTPYIDKWTRSRPLGALKLKRMRSSEAKNRGGEAA